MQALSKFVIIGFEVFLNFENNKLFFRRLGYFAQGLLVLGLKRGDKSLMKGKLRLILVESRGESRLRTDDTL